MEGNCGSKEMWKEDFEEEEGRKGRGRVREYREEGETAEGKEEGRGGDCGGWICLKPASILSILKLFVKRFFGVNCKQLL